MAIFRIIALFLAFVVVFMLQKAAFLLLYPPLSSGQWAAVWLHGLSMDLSVAAYLSVIPLLGAIVGDWLKKPRQQAILRRVLNIYFIICAVIIATITVVDLALYRYWHFRIDTTPIFYFTTSPSSAMASASFLEIAGGILAIVLLAWLLTKPFLFLDRICPKQSRRPTLDTALLIVAMPLLFLAIRGGMKVGTMNPSHAYFSTDTRLNHAAINPICNLLYSAIHQTNFGNQFRFFTHEEATAALAALNESTKTPKRSDGSGGSLSISDSLSIAKACFEGDSLSIAKESSGKEFLQLQRSFSSAGKLSATPLSARRVVVVILESFSKHLMPSMGGDSIAMRLDSIAGDGILFTNFYASSFRTDRALPAILSGMPGQPSTSIMRFVEKASRLPALARTLSREGFATSYYYGGDLFFTNMKAYVINSGFTHVVGDTDFPRADRASKWGAPDHLVFQKALDEMKAESVCGPRFTVIQTSSSHEPFEVPYFNPRFVDEPEKNAFAYTDSCLGAWYREMKAMPDWDKTLVVLVPDHYGCWPKNIASAIERHHVPLILAGGALPWGGFTIDTPGSQPDLAATVLGLLGIDSSEFTFSKNLLDPEESHYAIFTEPDLAGVVTSRGTTVINLSSGTPSEGNTADSISANGLKAYLQLLYDYLDQL